MSEHRVYLAIGSNIDPQNNIARALDLLCAHMRVTAISTFYKNPALDRPHDAPFVNGVLCATTQTSPFELKYRVLRGIEQALGRVRTEDKYAPRPIDLDILLYDDAIIHEPGLELPDADIRRRVFLAAPLLELAPDLVLPDGGTPLAQADCLKDTALLTPLPAFTDELKGRLKL